MVAKTMAEEIPAMKENFAELFNEMFGEDKGLEGSVVKGTIVALTDDFVTIDVGLKSEGRIARREFGFNAEMKVGDQVDVFIDRYEDKDGMVVLSREKARREEAWNELEKAQANGERVTGVIFGRVKGGFTVDLSGAIAFLPGSQVDIRPVRDVGPLMGTPQPFQILKMDRARGNIVVSRRAVLEENADAIAKYLGFLRSIVRADGLIEYGLGDWCQIGTRGGGEHWTPVCVTDTLAGMDICDKAAKIYRVLGQKEREEEAHALWLQLRAAMRKTCGALPPPRSCRTQTALSMMIAAGVYEENELPDAFRWLVDSVCGVQNRLLVGVFGIQSLLRVLCEQGMADTAYEMAMAPDRVSYGAMVAGGATSLWEIPHIAGNGISTGGVASLDHHFWGDIAAWYITYIAGIRVNEQFFDPSRVDISPYFIEKLAYAQASHRTPLGTVLVSWQRTGENEIEMFISLPAGAHGTLALHGGWECEGGAALLPGNTVIRAVRRAPLNAMRAEN